MNPVDTYEHGAQRPNNPTAEMATTSHPKRRAPRQHRLEIREKDRSRIPTLAWNRSPNGKSVSAPMLATVEKIDPAAWTETLCAQPPVGDLFASFDLYREPQQAKLDWYEHAGAWQNRLISADAKRAMASLLEHEQMAGAVQCVYFDPPYGMNFDARFLDDTLQVTAFRDTYENGIHSYLDGIRQTALLARELLSETGSFFMQIGDVNVHRCAMVLDEVFGPENRVSTITYATSGGGSSTRSISKAGDFILWYAKNFDAPMQFQALRQEQNIEDWLDSQTFAGGGGDFPDGTSRALKTHERRNPRQELPDVVLWRMGPLLSQGPSSGEQGKPFTYQGIQYGPQGLETAHWRVDQQGLQHLAENGRLWSNVKPGQKEAGANQLHFKMYRNDMPGKRVTNHWQQSIATSDKRYPVQTGNLAIQRCMLMTTSPGDLVLDPTGGSGTTALVAETWGRRWISIDSSRESIAVSRERILVHNYPMHLLVGSEEGFKEEQRRRKECGQEPLSERPSGGPRDPATGIVVDRMPWVTAASVAYENRPDKNLKRDIIWRVDQPKGGKDTGRVCSRFTVETELMEVLRNPDEMAGPRQTRRDADWKDAVLRRLGETGIRSDSDSDRIWDLEGIRSILDEKSDPRQGGTASHGATLVDRQSKKTRDAVIAIWPEDTKVDVAAIHSNVAHVMKRARDEVLVVVGVDFADGTEPGKRGSVWNVEVMRVRALTDLHLTEVRDAKPLVTLAEPAVRVKEDGKGQLKCSIFGWNEFNPVTGMAYFQQQENIRMWMLDTEYDGTQFCARRIHLSPTLRKTGNFRTLKALLGREGSVEALNAVFGWESHPFPLPKRGKIAVRVVTAGGGMMAWSTDKLPGSAPVAGK